METELGQLGSTFNQQNASKDDQIRALQGGDLQFSRRLQLNLFAEQVNTWRTKYEALAKLYSQLRHEHLELLQKFKQVQLKAASAQEAIDRRDKLEREIKTKNLELADMIRERDRALHEKDRLSGVRSDPLGIVSKLMILNQGNKEELEKLKRELRFALERADNAERAKGSELSSMLAKYNREMADLEEALRVCIMVTILEPGSTNNSDRRRVGPSKTSSPSMVIEIRTLSGPFVKRRKSWKCTRREWTRR